MSNVIPVQMPRTSSNDDNVKLVRWLVEHGTWVNQGDVICEVETTKALVELEAENDGTIFQLASPQSFVQVGQKIGWIGPSLEVINSHMGKGESTSKDDETRDQRPFRMTPRARALADRHGVDLEQLASAGFLGVVKETDVQSFLDKRSSELTSPSESPKPSELPPDILDRISEEGELSVYEKNVARNLRRLIRETILTTVDAEIDLSTVQDFLSAPHERGLMISFLHVLLHALGRTLPSFPRLVSFHHDGRIYQYQNCDIAFVLKGLDGKLYTPVVREVEKFDIEEIARSCYALAMRVNRGQIRPEELETACFTVSVMQNRSASRFVAIPNLFQSSILAVGGELTSIRMMKGEIEEYPATTVSLSYDHTLCDGDYAAEFLDKLKENLKQVK